MASTKRTHKRSQHGSRRASAGTADGFVLAGYEVTTEPLPNLPENKLPAEIASEVDRLYQLVRSHPADAVVELERWIARYPECPKLFNFLGAAYIGIGRVDKAELIARDAYKRFPNYLFAKLVYADFCLTHDRLDEFAAAFDGDYELGQICPERKRFHLTEMVAYLGTMGFYYALQGDVEQVKRFLKFLTFLDANSPMTKRLDRML